MPTRMLGLGLLLCLPAVPAVGQATGGTAQVEAALVPGATAIRPGGSVVVAIRIRLAPGWHIYAPDPGDLGVPTRVEWALPDGLTVRRIEWPEPEPVAEPPSTMYVYRGEIVVRAELAVADSWDPGEPAAVGARLRWRACRNVCLLQEADLSVVLPAEAPAPSEPRTDAASGPLARR